MSRKFPTDHDPQILREMGEAAEKDRQIVAEHKKGPGVLEPGLYAPDMDGKCQCIYCEVSHKGEK